MGAAERDLVTRGLRYSLALRLVVVGASSIVSLVLDPPRNVAAGVAAVLALNAWNLGYASLVRRPRGAGTHRVLAADLAVISAVCLTQTLTVPEDASSAPNWVLVALQVTLVFYPWQVGGRSMVVASLVLTFAYLGGSADPSPGGWFSAGPAQVWPLAEAALAWTLYRLVRRGARAADEVVDRGERLRRAADLAAARRADEREYLAALHDTAAATLLMVGTGVVTGREPWLGGQAARDLAVLRGTPSATGDADLLDLLRGVARHVPLTIRWHGAESVRMPAPAAVLLSRGAREALTNVVRHAGTGTAEIHVTRDDRTVTVEIIDGGRGFDPGQMPGERHGIARSLMERLAAVGGSAEVRSAPRRGTRVTMTCPVVRAEAPGPIDGDAGLIAASVHQGLRRAVVVLTLVILVLLDLPKLVLNRDSYAPAWPQYVAWCGLFAVTVAAGAVIWRGRSPGKWSWPLVAVVFVLSAAASSVVEPGHLLGVAHWSEGDAGWPVVLLLLDSPIGLMVGALAAQYAMTFGQAAVAGQAEVSVAGAVNATWVTFGAQLAIAVVAVGLRDLARASATVAREEERLRTAEAVAEQSHRDATDRFAALEATTVPLLRRLASGEVDPGDEAVRRQCALEAARLRRLFAADAAPDWLLHELRSCIEVAESGGASVSFAECGARPVVPAPARRRLIAPARAALATAQGKVRLTLAGTPDSVTVSVIAQCLPQVAGSVAGDGVDVSTLRHGDRLWIEATWREES